MEAKVIENAVNSAKIEIICGEEKNIHCGACGMAGHKSGKPQFVTARNEIGAKKGDCVEVELETGAKTKAALILFLVPLVVFLLAAGIATSAGISTPLILLISFIAVSVVLVMLKFLVGNKSYYYLAKIKERNV